MSDYPVLLDFEKRQIPTLPKEVMGAEKHKTGFVKTTPREWTDEEVGLAEKFYYNWVEEERKNVYHNQIVKNLRGEIAFLKAEYKAVTGHSIYEVL